MGLAVMVLTPHLKGMANARHPRPFALSAAFVVAAVVWAGTSFAGDVPRAWVEEWPNTDFSRTSVPYGDIQSGGPPKDGIPAIDEPQFKPVAEESEIPPTEPVIAVALNGHSKIYPLRILTWHEIVNDRVGGVPVAVTYCPLCNAGIVFDARLDGQTLTFGTTGKLRRSDLVMYDRQTESWWQQFSGDAIVGELTGKTLTMVPSRMEAFERAKARLPDALVLTAKSSFNRPYGTNPYVGYDTSVRPFLYAGDLPPDVEPMMRVVVVDGQAWTMALLKKRGRVEAGELVLSWTAGQNSALDTRSISKGRDVGNVTVQRRDGGVLKDQVHHVTFAFVFHAFHPEGALFKN